jgi:hypothetical protein
MSCRIEAVEPVKSLALRFPSRLPSRVELEDLVHDGILGLLDATAGRLASVHHRAATEEESADARSS